MFNQSADICWSTPFFQQKEEEKKGIFDFPHEKLISPFNNLLQMVWTFSSLIT